MIIHSLARGSSEIYLQGGICKQPVLLMERQDHECYIEHIQNFFVVIRNKQHQSFEVCLVNENDVFGNLPWLEGRSEGRGTSGTSGGGLIDRCFEQKKIVPLTPSTFSSGLTIPSTISLSSSSSSSYLPTSFSSQQESLIPDDYRILDMDVMEVCVILLLS